VKVWAPIGSEPLRTTATAAAVNPSDGILKRESRSTTKTCMFIAIIPPHSPINKRKPLNLLPLRLGVEGLH